jgi:hypothetical protein
MPRSNMALLDVFTCLNIANEEEFPDDLVVGENKSMHEGEVSVRDEAEVGNEVVEIDAEAENEVTIDEAGIMGDIQDPSEDNNTVDGIGEKGNLYKFYKIYCARYLPNRLNN